MVDGENLAAEVRAQLLEAREAGVPFGQAWDRSIYAVLGERGRGRGRRRAFGLTENERWRIALEGLREEWRLAYEGVPSPAGAAASMLCGALAARPGAV